jgi:hypothetical protein
MTFVLMGSQYQQMEDLVNSPDLNTTIYTSTGSVSYGINSTMDAFLSVAGYGFTNVQSKSGLGTVTGGLQGSWPSSYPILRVGAQAIVVGGTAKNQINTNRADGYNYFEVNSGYDFIGKLMQTFSFGDGTQGLKLHLNEAGVMVSDNNKNSLLLLSAGLQRTIISVVTLGVELNSRTALDMDDIQFLTDPLWVTPIVFIQAPYAVNVKLGVDVSLSKKRPAGQPPALEPYRVFGGLIYSFNVFTRQMR